MKSALKVFLAAALFVGPTAAWAKGESNSIRQYSGYGSLRIAGHVFTTAELQSFYANRGYKSIWYTNGRQNGNLTAYLQFIDNVFDAGDGNEETWIPLTETFSRTADDSSWITLELVATHSVMVYLNSKGIYDYSNLSTAASAGTNDFSYYIQHLRLKNAPVVVTKPPVKPAVKPPVVVKPAPTPVRPQPKPVHDHRYDNDDNGDDDFGQQSSHYGRHYNNGYDDNSDYSNNSNSNSDQNYYPPRPIPQASTNNNNNNNSSIVTVTTTPVVPQVNTPVNTAPIATSTSRYANDPTNDDVNAFYQAYGQSVWINYNSQPNEMADALRTTLRSADRHGLNPDDYWDANLENLYQSKSRSNGTQFESAATFALLRYVNHLNSSRVDPQVVDKTLFKFQLQKFTDYQSLTLILQGGSGQLQTSLDSLAPQMLEYKQLMSNLAILKNLKAQGTWKKVGQPATALVKGQANPVIPSVRAQLANLGYQNVGAGNIYDDAFEQATQAYLAANGLSSQMDYRFWNSLYKTVDERIVQVQLNLEKLRWIPHSVGYTHFAFVNLAAQEIRLMDDGQTIMHFRTVNGMPDRPTPSMMQQTKRVILNPTWTAPAGLTIKDKLPLIKQDPTYLAQHNMYVLNARTNQYVTDLTTVDWTQFTNDNNTPYYLVQGPGNQNALGVLKFPLQNMDGTPNADDIYMHDTNERELFGETNRYRSSGCIRLQFPLEFAGELLKGKMTVDDIKARVPWTDPTQIVTQQQTNQNVNLAKPLIVYVMYLTSEQNDDGSVRLFDDTYGLDAKILAALNASH